MKNSVSVYLDELARFNSFLSLNSTGLSQIKTSCIIINEVQPLHSIQDTKVLLRNLAVELKNKYR